MRRRQAFTLVEMLVSLALIMFIMAILSEAFVASAKTFRDLKAAADLADRLRVATNTLRRTLIANHFGAGQKLSDGSVWQLNNIAGATGQSPPINGFFRIYQGSPPTLEGTDSSIGTAVGPLPPGTALPSPTYGGVPNPFPSYRVTNCALHFTAQLSGSEQYASDMNSFFYANVPLGSPLLSLGTNNGEQRYQNPNAGANGLNPPYSCPWAEVVFFLQPTGDSTTPDPNTGVSLPLYALYMRQRLLVPYNTSGTQLPYALGGSSATYPEISGVSGAWTSGYLNCNRPFDITEPVRRLGMNSLVFPASGGSVANYSGQFANGSGYTTLTQDTGGSAQFAGADLLLTDVLSFEVRVLPQGFSDFADVFDMAKSGQWALNNPAFQNTATGPMAFDTWSQAPSMSYGPASITSGSPIIGLSNTNGLAVGALVVVSDGTNSVQTAITAMNAPPPAPQPNIVVGSVAGLNSTTSGTVTTLFDYTGWNGGTTANGKYDAIPFGDSGNGLPILKAVQITLRVWDLKSEMTRQVTIVVPL